MVVPSDINAPETLKVGLPAGQFQRLDAPADARLQVFLSYSRKDLTTAERLRDVLIARSFGAYLDKHDILPGEPWNERLAQLIETADTVVFLISPDSIASTVCDWEVNEAERLGKRILPVVIREAPAGAVPRRLQRLNYIFLRDDAEAAEGLARLETALLTDIIWVREHTRLGERAAEWERKVRADALLLRGSELADAELWVSRAHSGDQAPTDLHRAYITASREAEQARTEADRAQVARTRRFQKRAMWALMGVAVLLVAGLAGVIWQDIETTKREQAVFTSKVIEAINDNRYERAMRYALQAYPPAGALPWTPLSTELEGRLAAAANESRHIATLRGHSSEVRIADFSPDGRRLLTASDDFDSVLHVWDAASGKPAFSLPKQEPYIQAAAFSPDGRLIITAASASARVWNSDTGRLRYSLDGHSLVINDFAVSPDGASLATASDDGTVRVWDLQTGRPLANLRGGSDGFSVVTFSPDGARLAAGTAKGDVRIWEKQRYSEIALVSYHSDRVTSVAFNAASSAVLTGSWDKTVRLTEIGNERESKVVGRHDAAIRIAVLSPDGSRIVTNSNDGTVRLFDAGSLSEIAVLQIGVELVWTVRFTPDGRFFATANSDGSTRLWESEKGRPLTVLWSHTGQVKALAFTPDGRQLATGGADRSVRLWDMRGQPQKFRPNVEGGLRRGQFSNDGTAFATISSAGAAHFWQLADASRFPHYTIEGQGLTSIAFSPNGKLIATGARDGNLKIIESKTFRVLSDTETGVEINQLAFNPDGTHLAASSNDERILIFDVSNGNSFTRLNSIAGRASTLRFSSDGGRLITGSFDQTVRIWDWRHAVELRQIRASESVWAVDVGPEGLILAGLANSTLELIDERTGKTIGKIPHHKALISDVRINQDGRRFVTASEDRTAVVWDHYSRRPIMILKAHTEWVRAAAYHPAGRSILTASDDGTAAIWDASWLTVYGGVLRDRICSEKLRGAEEFTLEELEDPVLTNVALVDGPARNPCLRRGPFSWEYWARLVAPLLPEPLFSR